MDTAQVNLECNSSHLKHCKQCERDAEIELRSTLFTWHANSVTLANHHDDVAGEDCDETHRASARGV